MVNPCPDNFHENLLAAIEKCDIRGVFNCVRNAG